MDQQSNAPERSNNELRQIRVDKLLDLRERGKDPFEITKYTATATSKQIIDAYEEYEGKTVSVAGRIMSWRNMGKANFIHIQDNDGRLQSYVRMDGIGEEQFKEFKTWDIGDIVGIEGEVFKTRTGEVSVKAENIVLLAKSLLPLPEKYHGLKDLETRYRQRYVDLIVNPDVKDTFQKRSAILKEIRSFLDEKGYLEVDTPILLPLEIGASARPFVTHHNTLDMDMYLRIETELYLKRLIVGGFDKVYEVGRIFRNEGMDPKHNPEFTSIELYEAYTDFRGMMDLVEELYKRLCLKICGTLNITYQGNELDMGHWDRLTMAEAVKKYSGIDADLWQSDEDARACAKEHNVEVPADATRGVVLTELFDAFVEDKLIQPTFIYQYPVEGSPLAKRSPDHPGYVERFEYFICGTEYGNAFSELNDPLDQRERFEAQVAAKRAEDPTTTAEVDYDYIDALEYGLPPTGGLGFGVDRLVMLLTDSASIRDVLLFPTMRPLDSGKSAKPAAPAAEGAAPVAEAPATVVEETPAVPEVIDFSKVEIEPLFEEFVDFDTFCKSDFRAVKVLACEAVKKSKKLLQFTLDDGTGTERTILSGIHEYYEPEQLVGKTLVAITNLPPRKMMGIESCGMLISAVHHEEGEEKLHLLMLDNHIPAGAKMY